MSKKEQTVQEAVTAIAAAKAKLANLTAPTGGSGNLSSRVTLIKDVSFRHRYRRPPQVQKILNYLEALGGSATIEELIDLSEVATGGNVWMKNDVEHYRQDVADVFDHYHSRLTGQISWSAKERRLLAKGEKLTKVDLEAYVTMG